MIDHVSVGTNDIARAREFYDRVLGCLGLRLLQSDEHSADYGVFSVETPGNGRPATHGNGMHVAFSAGRRALVETFHRTALAHGGRDAGAPGLRPEYDAHYFAAFVFDPDGNKIEAVTRSSQ